MRTRTMPTPEAKPDAKSGGFDAARERDIFEDCAVNCRVSANGVVRLAIDHQKLPVGGGSFRGRIVYFVERKSIREPQIDKWNQRFFVPGLQHLAPAKTKPVRRRVPAASANAFALRPFEQQRRRRR